MNNLTLLEWCAEAYPGKTNIANAPALGEERQLYPAAEKHGREYRLAPGTIYIDPSDLQLGKNKRCSEC